MFDDVFDGMVDSIFGGMCKDMLSRCDSGMSRLLVVSNEQSHGFAFKRVSL